VTAPPYRLVQVRPPSASPLRVLIWHPLCHEYARDLAGRLPLEDLTAADLDREPLDTVDVLMTWKPQRDVLARLSKLRWVQTTSAGIDQLLAFLQHRPEVLVTTTKGLQAENVANLAAAMVLSLFWGLPRLHERQRAAVWQKHPVALLSGLTCAVLGLGHIGRRVASHARHFGMHAIGVRRQAEPFGDVDRVVGPEGLAEVLGQADYVVVTLPLTDRTRRLLGAPQFRTMKRSAYLVNVARGGIVDEDALAAALRTGEIAGAAMDVFEEEPLPAGHPLWRAPNLIITPHIGGDRTDYVEQACAIFAGNLAAFPDRARMRGVASTVDGY
jgi:D-2-hydroxyacid dehydrogenase (NADP+)